MGKKRITMANEANEGGGKNEAKVAEKGDLIGFPVPRSLAKVWVFLLVLLGYLGGRYLPMPVKCFVNPERIQLLPEAEPTGGNSGFLPSGVCLEQVSGVQPDKRTIYRLEVIVPKPAANDRLHVSSIDAIDGVR